MKLERRHEPLISRKAFTLRIARYFLLSVALIVVSLVIGIMGYRWIVGLDWIDAFLNASFILTGMGPVNPMPTTAAKIFAGVYAIFSGVVFISSVGILLAPAVHRLLHHFHLELEEKRRNG